MISGKAYFSDKYVSIKDASGYFCTSTIPLSMAGVSSELVQKPDEKASIYRCQICKHDSQKKAQAFTQMRHVHLGTCIQCCLCEYQTNWGVDMSTHLKRYHPTQEDEWVEPLPDFDLGTSKEVKQKWVDDVKQEPQELIVLDDE